MISVCIGVLHVFYRKAVLRQNDNRTHTATFYCFFNDSSNPVLLINCREIVLNFKGHGIKFSSSRMGLQRFTIFFSDWT